jgi:hypothetical protein
MNDITITYELGTSGSDVLGTLIEAINILTAQKLRDAGIGLTLKCHPEKSFSRTVSEAQSQAWMPEGKTAARRESFKQIHAAFNDGGSIIIF